MRSPFRLRGGGRPTWRWALAVALAVTGALVLALGVSVDDDPAPPSASAPVPGPAAAQPTAAPARGADATRGPSMPASPPVSLSIPSIGVDTDLDPLGLNPDGTVQVPTDFARAGWYTGAPTPGQIGPSVLLGHVDSYRGPAVFYRLDDLAPGDSVTVTRADGRPARFTVDAVRDYPKDQFPTDEVYGATDTADLRLITCGGPFDSDARSYRDNIVVYAHLADAGPAPEQTSAATAPDAALAGLTGPPTLYGRVTSVSGVDTAVVEVQRRRITVGVIGLDTTGTPACARADADAFARRMLEGQTVTLVPDPTLPPDPNASTWPAYLVLDTQQSYTDAAIRQGWAGAGTGRYRAGFLAEQRQAQDDDNGMWGPPCNRPT